MKRTDDPNYMQTAGRALDILALFEQGRLLSSSAIAKQTGLSTSVTHRLLFTLKEHGFVKQAPGSKNYFIGDKAVMLGLAGLHEKRVVKVAHNLMWEWRLQTGHTITLLCLIDQKAVVVERINVLQDDVDTLYLGKHYPLYRGASQRILLAYMDEDAQRAYIDSLFSERAAKDSLRYELEQIRSQGYDYTEQTMTKGIWGLSLPIFDANGTIAASISTAGHVENNDPEYIQERLEQLRQLAVKIQQAMDAEKI